MNADASPGVVAGVAVGAKVAHLGWVATGLVAGFVALAAIGTLLIALAVRSPAAAAAPEPIAAGAAGVALEARLDDRSRAALARQVAARAAALDRARVPLDRVRRS